MTDGFIPPHGGYRQLKSYQKAVIVYDATGYFCKRFFAGNRRQTDQMEQAARSGKQNIVEGSLASATSKQTELHLTNVAKASFGELQEDFEDFLRQRGLPIWDRSHPMVWQLTARARAGDEVYETYRAEIESESAEVSANTIRHLIVQASYLLGRQIQRLEQDLLREGGTRERMTAARREVLAGRGGANSRGRGVELRDPSACPVPVCPRCGAPMVSRRARTGQSAGQVFWGCSKYPGCRGTRPGPKEGDAGDRGDRGEGDLGRNEPGAKDR